MITGAGCSNLDYVLSGPEASICVDLNHQTALLELKLAAIRTLRYAISRCS
jgi:S-adenosylmethionine:diacylglycerol 3-amino-3-carboxypropyl transferase